MKGKKIGIDVKWHFSGPPSGIVVVKNLLNKFLKEEHVFTFYLFVKWDEVERFRELINKEFSTAAIEIVPVKYSNNFLQNLFLVPFLVKKHKIDLMVYMSYPPLLFPKSAKNVLFILDILDRDYPQFFKRIERAVFKLRNMLVGSVQHILTISYSEKERIHRHLKVPKKDITVVHLGVNEQFKVYDEEIKREIRARYGLPSSYILYIGRLNVRKNLPTLIEALKDVDSDWPLVLIGSKDGKSFDIDGKIEELGLKEKVIFLGFVEEEDMTKILSAASIFCYPSFAEGFGLPPLEAMKAGVPVITTRSTSIPEVCGEAVRYFDPFSAKDLSENINVLIKDPDLREEYSRKGQERVKMFTWDNSALQFSNVIKTL